MKSNEGQGQESRETVSRTNRDEPNTPKISLSKSGKGVQATGMGRDSATLQEATTHALVVKYAWKLGYCNAVVSLFFLLFITRTENTSLLLLNTLKPLNTLKKFCEIFLC